MKKKFFTYALIIIAALLLHACHMNDNDYYDTGIMNRQHRQLVLRFLTAKAALIFHGTGTGKDVAGHNVYYNYTNEGTYTLINFK